MPPERSNGRLATACIGDYSVPVLPIRALTPARVLKLGGLFALALALTAAFAFRNEVLRSSLDPKTPFQTYRPPSAPDYDRRSAWALLPATPESAQPADGAVDVFFVHPTTYSGGEEWNGPIDHARARRELATVMLPNYAGPFARVGRVFAPRYRQASLYAGLSLREDAQDARRFAYVDVRAAFLTYLSRFNGGRPFILVGVEQGGALAALLLRDEIARTPAPLERLVAAYLIQTVTPSQEYGPGSPTPVCSRRDQAQCVVAYMPAPLARPSTGRRILERALVWSPNGELEPLGDRTPVCVNPLLGAASSAVATERDNRGAANATALEWGLQPAFLPHEVSARCQGGLLLVSRPKSASLKTIGGWADRQMAPGYNVFYADLEADARARVRALLATPGRRLPAPPITRNVDPRRAPLMGR
jgi:hypothetical protein